jgi:putative ABC transport system permease protein
MTRKLRRLDGPDEIVEISVQEGDQDFLDLFGMKLVAGQNFKAAGDTLSYIINRKAAELLGWDDPIGQQLEWLGTKDRKIMTIVGVVEDYQNRSLHQAVAPGAIIQFPGLYFDLYLKIRPGRTQAVIPFLEKTWKRFLSTRPFRYHTMEEEFEWAYWNEFEFARTTRIFCGLAVLLACLGLYELAAFTTERRTKKIGIRKVLGASQGGLLTLVAREFAMLVLVANLIAWPLAYLYLGNWLNGFVRHIDLSVVPFVTGGGVVLLNAMATISIRTYSSAQKDPVEAIRTE